MSRSSIERKLSEGASRLHALRADLLVTDEQLRQFNDQADDARLRAIVGDNPQATKEHRETARHAEAMSRHRRDVVAEIARLESNQDDLLDKLIAAGSS